MEEEENDFVVDSGSQTAGHTYTLLVEVGRIGEWIGFGLEGSLYLSFPHN